MSYLKYQNCIAACMDCAAKSKHCAVACLDERDIIRFSHCIRLGHGSVSICVLAMDAISEESAFIKQICKLCARICICCATECEKHSDTEHCKICAKACRKCADECMQIAVMDV